MVKVEHITKDWKEAGSFPAQVNLYGFWDEHSFLTKSGDLGAALRIGGIDYERPAAVAAEGQQFKWAAKRPHRSFFVAGKHGTQVA
jgi:type IV secretion system protein VirB4